MWSIRVMSGRQTGTFYDLKPGKNIFGREETCDFQIQNAGASKKHFEINVMGEKLVLTDLKSSNGTFVNGVRVRNVLLRVNDKIAVHDVLFEVSSGVKGKNALSPSVRHMPLQGMPQSVPMGSQGESRRPQVPMPEPIPKGGWERFDSYMDTVVLPGVYQLPRTFEVRSIVIGFAMVFVLLVTLLSILPMKQVTQESVETESRRRAQTLARALAASNERVVRGVDSSSYTTDLVLREEGIDDVFIISKDGTIIAPPERAGNTPKEAGFIKEIKMQNRDVAKTLSNGKVAASSPILVFDPELQQNTAKAHAVVIYNPGSLSFDDERALSLFIQTLILSCALGLVLFYFLYKAIEHPIIHLRKELDKALREGAQQISSPMKFFALQDLLVSMNSLLARSQTQNQAPSFNRSAELELKNLIGLMGYPALLMNYSKVIVTLNKQFEMLTGYSEAQLMNQNLSQVPDQAFQKNVESLLLQASGNSQMVHRDQLEISGHNFFLNCQAFPNPEGEVEFYIVSLSPFEAVGGAA